MPGQEIETEVVRIYSGDRAFITQIQRERYIATNDRLTVADVVHELVETARKDTPDEL